MKKSCKNCNKPLKRLRKSFCSTKCVSEYISKKNLRRCPTCGKFFNYKGHQKRERKFCSKKCYGISIRGQESIFKGRKHTIESRKKMSESSKG